MNLPELLIPKPDFDDFVAGQLFILKSQLATAPRSVMPCLAILTLLPGESKRGVTFSAIAGPFNEHKEKRAALLAIARDLYKRHQIPLALAMTSEAWVAEDRHPHVQPRDCLDRREALILSAQRVDRKFLMAVSIHVRRDAENRMHLADDQPQGEIKAVRSSLLDYFLQAYASGDLPKN